MAETPADNTSMSLDIETDIEFFTSKFRTFLQSARTGKFEVSIRHGRIEALNVTESAHFGPPRCKQNA